MWQDIETAPKDGTSILVTCRHLSGHTAQVAFWDKGMWWLDDGTNCRLIDIEGYAETVDAPTDWMPLPPPPGVWVGLGDK